MAKQIDYRVFVSVMVQPGHWQRDEVIRTVRPGPAVLLTAIQASDVARLSLLQRVAGSRAEVVRYTASGPRSPERYQTHRVYVVGDDGVVRRAS